MTMKTALLLMGLLSIPSAFAYEGGNGSHGGGVHYCAGSGSAEFYDLYEGRVRYGLTIRNFGSSSIEMIVRDAYTKLAKKNHTLALEAFGHFESLFGKDRFRVMDNVDLVMVDDANIVVVGKGCAYKQLANWDEVIGAVLVDASYFRRLNNLSRAALYIHESLYKAIRSRKPDIGNSDKIRRMVAELLSSSTALTSLKEFTNEYYDVLPNLTNSEGLTESNAEDLPNSYIVNVGRLADEDFLKPFPIILTASTDPAFFTQEAEMVKEFEILKARERAANSICENTNLRRRERKAGCALEEKTIEEIRRTFKDIWSFKPAAIKHIARCYTLRKKETLFGDPVKFAGRLECPPRLLDTQIKREYGNDEVLPYKGTWTLSYVTSRSSQNYEGTISESAHSYRFKYTYLSE